MKKIQLFSFAVLLCPTFAEPLFRLSVAASADHPTEIKVVITNLSSSQVPIAVTDPGVLYQITLRRSDGSEPSHTPAGEILRKGLDFFGRFKSEKVESGASLTQTVDLGLFWVLTPGSYTVSIKRTLDFAGRSEQLSASTLLTVPDGFIWEKACMPEARSALAPNRARAALDIKTNDREPDLLSALDKPLRHTATRQDNNIQLAFISVMLQAKLTGGLVLESGTSGRVVCLEGTRNVREVLEEFRAVGPELSLDWSSASVNFLDSGVSDFLETRISTVTIARPTTNMLQPFEEILSTPEMVARAVQLKMVNGRLLNNALLGPAGTPSEPLVLHNVTAREAMNAVARKKGSGAWVYVEANQGVARVFQITSDFRHGGQRP